VCLQPSDDDLLLGEQAVVTDSIGLETIGIDEKSIAGQRSTVVITKSGNQRIKNIYHFDLYLNYLLTSDVFINIFV